MKLVKLKCPQCNANLEVNNDLTMAVCNYCGCSFYIDAEQVKQSQEATRKKKARENASHCLTQIISVLPQLQLLHSRKCTAEMAYMNAKAKYTKATEYGGLIKMIIVLSLVFLMNVILFREKSITGIQLFVTIVVVLIFGAIFYGIRRLRCEHCQKCVDRCSETLHKISAEQKKLVDENELCEVPEDYWDKDILLFMKNTLDQGKTDSIPEAIEFYEEYARKKEMEEMQKEQLQIQKEQLEQLRMQNEQLEEQKRQIEELKQKDENTNAWGAVAAVGGAFVLGAKILHDITKEVK